MAKVGWPGPPLIRRPCTRSQTHDLKQRGRDTATYIYNTLIIANKPDRQRLHCKNKSENITSKEVRCHSIWCDLLTLVFTVYYHQL